MSPRGQTPQHTGRRLCRQHTSRVSLNKNPWNFSKVWKRFIIILSVVLSFNGLPCSSNGKESACNTGDPGSIPGSGRSSVEGNGNPLQNSCLESPMDRGAWRATIHGIAKSQTGLRDLTCRVRLLATPWTTAYQAPPSMGFSRQEYWSGVLLPSPCNKSRRR